MKIAIIADSHNNIPNIEKAFNWINKKGISVIFHCGDLADPSIFIKVAAPKFSGQINFVLGNADDPELAEKTVKNLKNVKIYKKVGQIEFDNKKIAFTHFPKEAIKLAKENAFDLVFYGHTHKPWEKKIGHTRLVNPGTLAGMFYKATFAVYNTKTDKLELKILEKLEDNL